MNNRIKFLMIAFVAIVSIASCKKEIDYRDPNGNGCQLTKLKSDGLLGNFIINMEYDAAGRLTKATTPDGQIITYVYTSSKVTATDQDGIVDEINLSGGRATSSTASDFVIVGSTKYKRTRRYSYNAEGYLIQVKTYLNDDLNSTDDFSYTNGNLVKAILTFASGGVDTSIYTYSNEKAVNTYNLGDPLSYHVDYFPGKFFGKPSKNVLTGISSTSLNNSGELNSKSIGTFTYQFDAKGNATSMKITDTYTSYNGSGTGTTDTNELEFELSYTCK